MGPAYINLTLPTPGGGELTQDEETAILGQWVTVLAFGQNYLAQVEEVTALPWDGARMDIRAKVGQPAEEPLEPEFHPGTPAPYTPTHINCEHDPAGINMENAMVCDGPVSQA